MSYDLWIAETLAKQSAQPLKRPNSLQEEIARYEFAANQYQPESNIQPVIWLRQHVRIFTLLIAMLFVSGISQAQAALPVPSVPEDAPRAKAANVLLPEDGGTLSFITKEKRWFIWSRVDGATYTLHIKQNEVGFRYSKRLTLSDFNCVEAWCSTNALNLGLQHDLLHGQAYRWWVIAEVGGEKLKGQKGTFVAELKQNPVTYLSEPTYASRIFVWFNLPETQAYGLVIKNAAGAVVVKQNGLGNQCYTTVDLIDGMCVYELTSAQALKLKAGKTYSWSVKARNNWNLVTKSVAKTFTMPQNQ